MFSVATAFTSRTVVAGRFAAVRAMSSSLPSKMKVRTCCLSTAVLPSCERAVALWMTALPGYSIRIDRSKDSFNCLLDRLCLSTTPGP